ncbi:OsmC family protein [Methylocella silvestris BL2]|uniref:OsmC family protein n=1 Tax=Methylocella silvestris (strain DSM 15510 / CIP 108128 / LMG 27833 / NCIMB 13906 / BL2) TaxID=395965 RepID=B8ETB2_METSB|nr:OsmC family protein [Methylocella silvestris]ACK51754.1 OsmC family protein [Methylocella silvestris BL2]
MTDSATTVSGLQPVDKAGLDSLIEKGKANPEAVRTLKARTVAAGKFRQLNYIRNLPEHVVDEPPGLLGDDTAPNPSEAALAALGSCLSVGILANALAQGVTIRSLEIDLEGDINISAVWGAGATPDSVGFSAVRAAVKLDADAPQETLDALVAHATVWSPVANTFTRAVPLEVKRAG